MAHWSSEWEPRRLRRQRFTTHDFKHTQSLSLIGGPNSVLSLVLMTISNAFDANAQ